MGGGDKEESAEDESGEPLWADGEHGRSSDARGERRRERKSGDRESAGEREGVCSGRERRRSMGETEGGVADRRRRSRERICE